MLFIGSVIKPTIVGFRIDGIKKIDFHILCTITSAIRMQTFMKTNGDLRQQHLLFRDEVLRKYIFVLVHLYSFVNTEDVQQLVNSSIDDQCSLVRQIKIEIFFLSQHLLNASSARNFDRSRSNFVKCIGSLARFLAMYNRSISQ
jgi:hypothetical protein